MYNVLNRLGRLFCRFRHPVSIPEDVAQALGLHLSNFLSVHHLLQQLRRRTLHPSRLNRFMPRTDAEAAFCAAIRCERFGRHTLCSFLFDGNWLEFSLQFDECNRLRRIYVLHCDIPEEEGIELPLPRI